ncbi:hypothetical protein GTW25_04000 [Aliihoeflea aestuarii]|jgi:hypothetical protein|uniref:OpgC family protein n=1 Tax=Aliihoeflea aestuarii TaxID=453840 RepID=UPI002092FA13|nr:OpgC domain-containing protein [Aliihoeflea aestuarii]MCO6390189.1 hypothetical protein [Aliihoeflea aestuarii]
MSNGNQSLRDTRIDVIRAIALLTIFVNHVPGNPIEVITHKNFGFSDSAEAFVLVSGISAALAYGLKFETGNRLIVTLKTWRRAGVLYIAQLGTTMATIGIFSFFALYFGAPHLLAKINIEPVMTDTAAALLGVVTLGHQLGYNNILSMYAVVLLMLPLFLLIGTFSIGWMVAASGIMWLVAGLLPIAPPHFPNNGYWFLNPFSWQLLFVLGLAAMMHIKRGGSLPVNRWLVGAAALYLTIALLWVRLPLWGLDVSMGLPSIFTGFSKTFLSLPRMMHVVAIAYLLYALPAVSNIFRTSVDNPLAVLGRYALPVFVVGTILSMAAQAWRGVFPPTIISDVTIVAVGIALQFALAYYIDWYRRLIRTPAKEPRRVVLHGRELSPVPARPNKNQPR